MLAGLHVVITPDRQPPRRLRCGSRWESSLDTDLATCVKEAVVAWENWESSCSPA
jgi:hypothetical protein